MHIDPLPHRWLNTVIYLWPFFFIHCASGRYLHTVGVPRLESDGIHSSHNKKSGMLFYVPYVSKNPVPAENYFDERDGILPKSIFVKYVLFFLMCSLLETILQILNHLSNRNKTHSYVYIIIFSVSSNLAQISQNHVLYGWGSKRCGHFLNNSIQANYNYFVVCVCKEKKESLTCASQKKIKKREWKELRSP